MKKKMSNRLFRAILIPITVLLCLLLVLVQAASSMLWGVLDTYIAKGQNRVVNQGEPAVYYEHPYADGEEAMEAAYQVAARVQKEGSILLKNNGVLPLSEGSRVMPFGYAYLNPSYGQNTSGGSAKWVVDPVTPEKGLEGLTVDSAAADRMKAAGDPVITVEASGTKAAGEADSMLGGDCKLYEYDASIYDGLAAEPDTVGIVFLSRTGQEGTDMKYDGYEDGTPHYLALSENEKNTIRAAKETCGQVVAVIIASAPMELAPITKGDLEVDAILWMGHPGERGLAQLAPILTGQVNPSGRTVDTYAADMTADPSYQSIGINTYSNYKAQTAGFMGDALTEIDGMYNEYMEGVYMGYRYYETADLMDESFRYEDAVLYPFGYGLSYTTFEQKLDAVTKEAGTVTAKVTVTNTGDRAGKEVVQLYLTAPYTDLDAAYIIEKPAVNLAAFAKTAELAPGESKTLELSFDLEDQASYCYTRENPDGTTGCYMLEEGDYTISLRANSHDLIDEAQVRVDETVWYDGSDLAHIRSTELEAQSVLDESGIASGTPMDREKGFTAATNLFQTMSDYMNEESTILSRTDWEGTAPLAAEGRTKTLSDKYASLLGTEVSFDPQSDPLLGNVEGSLVYADREPVSGAKNGLVLSDLRGLSYNDEKWDLLLDQIDWKKDKDMIIANFSGAAYNTFPVQSIGLPGTVEPDGANGLKVSGGTDSAAEGGYDMTASSSFGFAPLMASTWNVDLLYEIGLAFGQESLYHGINGWYCPAINLHRSPFSGRVFEYYSEDPLLTGKLAASVISGAGDAGMFCYVKHFALNDTETGRASLISTWADEQTMRELYLKAFEIAFKEARSTLRYMQDGEMKEKVFRSATAVMPAQNGVGTVVGECNYALLTSLLRGEWGFRGMAVTDYWVWGPDNLRDYSLRAGSDTYLCMNMALAWGISDYESATAKSVMRSAIHNIAYTVVNSNAMEGAAPGDTIVQETSPWVPVLNAVKAVLLLLIVLLIGLMVRRAKDEKKHPEMYKRKAKKR